MFLEMRTYTLECGKTPEYLSLYEAHGLALHAQTLGKLVGVFTAETGELDQIVFMNAYEDLKQRSEQRAKLYANLEWQSYASRVRGMITRQESKILVAAPCYPIK